MRFFVIVIVVISSLETIASLLCLITDKIPARTPFGMAMNMLLGVVLIIWGIALLAG